MRTLRASRPFILTLTAVCWIAAVIITWLRIEQIVDDRWAVVVICLIGAAVTLTVKLSRMRMVSILIEVFAAGGHAHELRKLQDKEDNGDA